MTFSTKSLSFLRGLAKNNNKTWFDSHRADYETELREPMGELIEEMDARMRRFAPEIGGDPKRSMFRINRDIRFSADKSPYKTHVACWFFYRGAQSKVGSEADGGSAGFYFHLQPGQSMVGGGLWMPPRPPLNRLRAAIADDHLPLARIAKSLARKYGGLDDERMLKRPPRGIAPDHPAGKWLQYQSFTTGRRMTDAEATAEKLPAQLEKDFQAILPLVRWLNGALGFRDAGRKSSSR